MSAEPACGAPRSFLFAAGFLGVSRTLDHAIKHATGLSPAEGNALDEVLRALLARNSSESGELRAVLVQRGGVVLSLRGRRAADHEGRPSWVIFGRLEGALDPRASWSARAVLEDGASDALPLPPEKSAADPEYRAFFDAARERGRAWRFDERAPRAEQGSRPWIAGLLALALITAMLAPWPEPWPQGARTSAPPMQAEDVERSLRASLMRHVREKRERLLAELRILDEREIWRFGKRGEPEIADEAAAGLQRILRALRTAVESGSELAPIAWEERFWPRDGRGVPIEARLVLLGPRTLSDAELRELDAWLALLGELYRRAARAR